MQHNREVEPVAPPAVAGEADEAKAYRFTLLDVKGKQRLYEYLTVVRSGAVTLAFRAEILGTEDFGGVPQPVVTAHWKKFRTARDGAEDAVKDTAAKNRRGTHCRSTQRMRQQWGA